jgi:hypothetical protein
MNPDINSLPLRDIHLPEPVSWWPPAVGWWIVAGLLLLLALAVFAIRAIRNKRRLKRAALAEFNAVIDQYQHHQDPQQLVNQLSTLLRRLSVSTFPNRAPAGLTGRAWLEFLDAAYRQNSKKTSLLFCSDVGEQLIKVPYRKTASVDREQLQSLIDLCRQWIAVVVRHPAPSAATESGV